MSFSFFNTRLKKTYTLYFINQWGYASLPVELLYKCKEIDYLFLTKATSTTWAFFLIERNDLGTKKKKKNIQSILIYYFYIVYLFKIIRWHFQFSIFNLNIYYLYIYIILYALVKSNVIKIEQKLFTDMYICFFFLRWMYNLKCRNFF